MASIIETQGFSAAVYMNRAFEKAASSAATDFTTAAVHHLAVVYNFDAAEALSLLGLDAVVVKKSALRKKGEGKQKSPKVKAPKRVVPMMPLPWCGEANDDWCSGLRLNHGLHSQCTNLKQDGEFCITCQRQADRNTSGKPTYGTTTDRAQAGVLEFRCPKTGKQTLPYANVMKKLNITREKAVAEASKFGMSIPEEHFEERKTQRGRPKKDASASDTDSAASTPKKRGRPAKAKKVVKGEVGDDLIASLVAISAQGAMASPPAAPVAAVPRGVLKAVTATATSSEVPTAAITASVQAATPQAVTASVQAATPPAVTVTAPVLKAKSPKKSPEEKAARKAAQEQKITELRAEWSALASTRPGKMSPQFINGELVESGAIGAEAGAAAMTKIGDLQKAIAALKRLIKEEEKAANKKEEEEKMAKKKEEELVEEQEQDEEEEEVTVVRFEHDGVKYLKTADNMLYFEESQEAAGMWDPVTNTVTAVDDDDSDDDEEA